MNSTQRLNGFGNNAPNGLTEQGLSAHRRLYRTKVAPLRRVGMLKNAEPILRLMAQDRFTLPEVYRDLGELAQEKGHLSESQHWTDLWLNTESETAEQLWEQGQRAETLGRVERAREQYSRMLQLTPNHLGALQHAARLEIKAGNLPTSLDLFGRWLEQEATNLEALTCRAICLLELKCYREAEDCVAAVVTMQNLDAGNWKDVLQALQARLHQKKGNEEQAWILTKPLLCALAKQNEPAAWPLPRLLAPILLEQQRLESLDPVIEQAITIQPESPELHGIQAEKMLLQGHLEAGYKSFDRMHYSHEKRGQSQLHGCSLPRFHPGESTGPLALIANGTLGDTLMLSRYGPWLQKRFEHPVSLYVQPPLLNLLRFNLPDAIKHRSYDQIKQQKEGFTLPLSALPGLFGSCEEHAELSHPNLKADPSLVSHWREQLDLRPGEMVIGLNWHGSAMQAIDELHRSDIPLETFSTVSQVLDQQLISLQKGIGHEQLAECSFRGRFVNAQEIISREYRMEHVAAQMELCSWLITDDSGPAHLAGCLGIPCVVLLPERINWRWGSRDAKKAPWYPTVRPLRKQADQTWGDLMSQALEVIQQGTAPGLCDENPKTGSSLG